MYHVFDGLKDALDGDLDTAEAARIEAQLAIAKQSDRTEIVTLANAIDVYLQKEKGHLAAAKPDIWKRFITWVDATGMRLGRRVHRTIILALLVLWVVFVISYMAVLVLGGSNFSSQIIQWRGALLAIQTVIGGSIVFALIAWLTGNEERGMKSAISGFLFSLVALQTLYFYISQFSAITATLLQLAFLQLLLAYNRWYLRN
jgi:hypothetical protein